MPYTWMMASSSLGAVVVDFAGVMDDVAPSRLETRYRASRKGARRFSLSVFYSNFLPPR
jgi:hypothetical protein